MKKADSYTDRDGVERQKRRRVEERGGGRGVDMQRDSPDRQGYRHGDS